MKNTEAAGLPLKRGSAEAFEKAPYLRNPLLRRPSYVTVLCHSGLSDASRYRHHGMWFVLGITDGQNKLPKKIIPVYDRYETSCNFGNESAIRLLKPSSRTALTSLVTR